MHDDAIDVEVNMRASGKKKPKIELGDKEDKRKEKVKEKNKVKEETRTSRENKNNQD